YQGMQKVRSRAKVVDASVHRVPEALRRTAGSDPEQRVRHGAVVVVDNSNRSFRGGGCNVGGSGNRSTRVDCDVAAVHVLGKLAGVGGCDRSRKNRRPLTESIGHQHVGGTAGQYGAEIPLVGVIVHLALRPGEGLAHRRRVEIARARHIIRSTAVAERRKQHHESEKGGRWEESVTDYFLYGHLVHSPGLALRTARAKSA